MLFTIFLPLFSIAVSAELIPALQPRAPESHLDARQSTNPLLGKRQFCSSAYPYTCTAIDGESMCMEANEVCCQRIAVDGTFPFVCPVTHPYCCPSDTAGNPLCGSDSTCSDGGSDQIAPSHGLATQSSGVKPTEKTAQAEPTRTGGAATPAKSTGTAERMGLDSGVLVAAILGGLVMA